MFFFNYYLYKKDMYIWGARLKTCSGIPLGTYLRLFECAFRMTYTSMGSGRCWLKCSLKFCNVYSLYKFALFHSGEVVVVFPLLVIINLLACFGIVFIALSFSSDLLGLLVDLACCFVLDA